MEDIPPNMPSSAYGAFEPDGMCIWVNLEDQASLPTTQIGVVAHEYSHYVHAISSLHGVDDIVSLLFGVHAGIQRLEDWAEDVEIPLSEWCDKPDCPPKVSEYVRLVKSRDAAIRVSYRSDLDPHPLEPQDDAGWYRKADSHYIRMDSDSPVGVPICRLTLMEGMAVAKKCEAVGNTDDIASKTAGRHWHYVVAYEACKRTNPQVDPIVASKYLCDLALCSPDPGEAFVSGLKILRDLGSSSTERDVEEGMIALYDEVSRSHMQERRQRLHLMHQQLPEDRFESPAWDSVTLKNSLRSLEKRDSDPLSLARPIFIGMELFGLATEIGSPVVITNDMRLTFLYKEDSVDVQQAVNSVRTLSALCQWILKGGTLVCPYAGCPGCPPERAGEQCRTDARLVIAGSEALPWCNLFWSAKQLRITEFIRDAPY